MSFASNMNDLRREQQRDRNDFRRWRERDKDDDEEFKDDDVEINDVNAWSV